MIIKNTEDLRNILLRTAAAAAAAALLITTGCSLSHGGVEDTTDTSAVSTAAPDTAHDFSTGP